MSDQARNSAREYLSNDDWVEHQEALDWLDGIMHEVADQEDFSEDERDAFFFGVSEGLTYARSQRWLGVWPERKDREL